jgi:hypothetical protein
LALVIVSLVSGFISILQFMAAKQSADVALRAVNVAQDTRDDNNISGSDTLIQMKAQSMAMRKSAEAMSAFAEASRKSADVARKSYIAGDRPFIGVSTIECKYFSRDASGARNITPQESAQEMDFTAWVKNFGPIPGTKFTAEWKAFMNGREVRGKEAVPFHPSILMPTQSVGLSGSMGPNSYRAAIRGKAIVTLEITVQYSGPSGDYKECTKQQYSESVNGFYDLGPLCSAK